MPSTLCIIFEIILIVNSKFENFRIILVIAMVERIRELCEKKNLTIQKLEIAAGLSNGSISKWEKSDPKVGSLSAVASILGVSMEYLMYGEQKPPVNSDERSAGVINWVETFQDKDELIKLLSAYQNIAPEKRPVYLEILQRGGEHKE